jgi:chemotaxis response regulator CheB
MGRSTNIPKSVPVWRNFQSVDCVVRHKGNKKRMSFTIVGIGASAGGLESFSELIARIPAGDPAEKPHRPVDVLFHSLAQQRGPNAIGIILSGSGSDGAKGIQAIKQAGGITFAQDESSALFFGMPSCAIKIGCVDFILDPKEIAQELIRISRHHT